MGKTFCAGYCGLACVNGTCPKIENRRYHCIDCWLYKGCEDCCFKGTVYCDHPELLKGGADNG